MLVLVLAISNMVGFSSKTFAASCQVKQTTLLGIPTWYKYLGGSEVQQRNPADGSPAGTVCQPLIWTRSDETDPSKNEKLPRRDMLLIAAAIIDILLRVAGLAAFIYLLYGGFMYLTSSGNSEGVKKAGSTLLNAAIGLAIAISATTIVNYFAGRLSGT
ncbi:MAG: hypothetical protein QG623_697 [Patescibacteria group bacterium]|nr:hypothetical protein [Patescibacteria group bacterium]